MSDDTTADDADAQTDDYPCPDCEKSFDSQRGLSAHSRVHDDDESDAESDESEAEAEPEAEDVELKAARETVRGYILIDQKRGRFVSVPIAQGLPEAYP